MPLHKHEPVSEESMAWASPNHSICQVLREIYFNTWNEENKRLCRVATAMAKSMTAKLEGYKQDWEKGFWDKNKNFETQASGTTETYLRERQGKSVLSKSGKTYDVLVICENDWSNSGWRYSKCLRSIGLNVIGMKMNPHPFFYPEALPTYPNLQNETIQRLVNESHVVVLHNTTFIQGIDFSRAIVVAQHGGTVYRQHHDEVNATINPIAQATVIQCPDLLGLGAKNEHWVSFPVDTDFLQPVPYDKKNTLTFGHFPSNHTVKGTAAICKVVDSIKDPRFKYIGLRPENAKKNIKTWNENLNRLAACDVYLESLSPTQGKKVYGEFGNQALEAAAMGKIVITNCVHKELYEKEFGKLGLIVANTEEELRAAIDTVLGMSAQKIAAKRKAMRDWVVSNHSISAVGQRLWGKVYRNLFEGR